MISASKKNFFSLFAFNFSTISISKLDNRFVKGSIKSFIVLFYILFLLWLIQTTFSKQYLYFFLYKIPTIFALLWIAPKTELISVKITIKIKKIFNNTQNLIKIVTKGIK